MTNVYFTVDLLRGNDLDTVDEFMVVDKFSEYQDELQELDAREGALVIQTQGGEPVSIVDDLDAAVQRLCFLCIPALLDERRECFLYRGMSAAGHVVVIPVGPLILIIGDEIPPIRDSKQALLPALFQCGLRYLSLLERLDLQEHVQYLRVSADQARDSLVRHGLLNL